LSFVTVHECIISYYSSRTRI